MLHITTYQQWPSFPWQSGRRVGNIPSNRSRVHGAAAPPLLERGVAQDKGLQDAGRHKHNLPTWWIVFQMFFWAPQWVTGGLLGSVLIPFRMIELVGERYKTHALALTTVTATVVNLCGPFFGAASDALPYTRFGRRRPFVFCGMIGVCGAIWLMKEAGSYTSFMLGWVLFVVGNNTAQPAYSCVLPELIPEHQRGLGARLECRFRTQTSHI